MHLLYIYMSHAGSSLHGLHKLREVRLRILLEVIGRVVFEQFTLAEHENAVVVHNCGQSVGNSEHRSRVWQIAD